jgi:hypothetical protein
LEEVEMEMARCDDQDFYDVSEPNLASAQIFADLDKNGPHSRPAHHSNSAEPDLDRYGESGTEPTLDKGLREPAIPDMRRDNVTEDQLLQVINTACRHINR